MAHNHEHQHNHTVESLNKAFITGIILNLSFVLIEFSAGFYFNSLGLLSDAGHNLGDVASLFLALLAFRLAKVRANARYTYGYKKSTVLVSLLNAVILLIAVGAILTESIEKIVNPRPVEGGAIAWVAGIGVFVNAFTAMLFMRNQEKDLNVRGAYLHMAADTLVSVGVLISGVVISYTGWYVIDPIIGISVAVVILISTWNLLHESIRLSLDGVPISINSEDIKEIISEIPEVISIHHLHIWAISTTENAMTAHIVIPNLDEMEELKHRIKDKLQEAGISHVTLEFETEQMCCKSGYCI
ncbi:cation diffusion facilitator family transporter [uncultured Bacteroides sp.]|uniref:cation diffusion facilitator family transporter n=1 Tax=uncultured Bacteroides sp. TaxID=162156 RepID=UPI002AAAC3BF|nr:cation diffusion facilitator family transporter [uncultured Bacteroides sp.]